MDRIDSWPMHSVYTSMHMHSLSPASSESMYSVSCVCFIVAVSRLCLLFVYGTNELASFEYFRCASPAEDFHRPQPPDPTRSPQPPCDSLYPFVPFTLQDALFHCIIAAELVACLFAVFLCLGCLAVSLRGFWQCIEPEICRYANEFLSLCPFVCRCVLCA